MRIEFYAFSYSIGFIKKYLSSYTGSTYEQLLANSEFLYIENSIALFSRNGCHLKSFILVMYLYNELEKTLNGFYSILLL